MSRLEKHSGIYLIGMSNHPTPDLSQEVLDLIQANTVFSGGKRHYSLVKAFLPEQHTWIEISGKMEALTTQYAASENPVVVFVSGDPFFYGFGNTLQRLMPEAQLKAFPYFNSIQRLCHKTQTNYNALTSVSVHGRTWAALDEALIQRKPLIGVLTDNKKTPAAIAQRLLEYGFSNYEITVGEALDGSTEKIETLTLADCTEKNHQDLNCVLLRQTEVKHKPLGFPDEEFMHLANRQNMITKLPIRLSTMSALQLDQAKVLWDVGSCTGSIAIEAKNQAPHLQIVAFEKRPACAVIIPENTRRFSTPGIHIIIEDFFELDLSEYPIPDVVFIGGHGGRLAEMLTNIHALNPAVRFVTNAVTANTTETFKEVLEQLNYTIQSTAIQVDQHNLISIHAATKA